jgi:hypothetical protein
VRERFYVVEHSGYAIAAEGKRGVGGRDRPEVMVCDRVYCHRVVWSSWTTPMERVYRYQSRDRERPRWRTRSHWFTGRQRPLAEAVAYANELAAQLNAELAA